MKVDFIAQIVRFSWLSRSENTGYLQNRQFDDFCREVELSRLLGLYLRMIKFQLIML